MKKSSKPLIIVIASLLVLLTIIILIAQGLRLKYEGLQRELTQLESRIKSEKTQSVSLMANYQMLTEEDLIKKYAFNELGLVNSDNDNGTIITLSKENIANLFEKVESLNE